MMRPMKLAGSELMFGQGCLEHLKSIKGTKAFIVTGIGGSLKKSGILDKVINYLKDGGIESEVFAEVEGDPSFATVIKGANKMKEFSPDVIVALGGGSPMDAAKAMWVYYEYPNLSKLEEIVPPNQIPKLRNKAIMVCIPSTSGTASEVSRSVVISDEKTGIKYGIGNMEMMPDIAICDPEVTASMPPRITSETGMDALTHGIEAYVSNRGNYVSDIFAIQAIVDIFEYLPKAFEDGKNLYFREKMLNASMIAGMAFTNVSLGIVHSMAHTLGSYYHVPHGLADAIILPYVIEFNSLDKNCLDKYNFVANEIGVENLKDAVVQLNAKLNIPSSFSEIITDKVSYEANLENMAKMALADGCTKTNPIIPTIEQFKELFRKMIL